MALDRDINILEVIAENLLHPAADLLKRSFLLPSKATFLFYLKNAKCH